jgi:hypothetical protein
MAWEMMSPREGFLEEEVGVVVEMAGVAEEEVVARDETGVVVVVVAVEEADFGLGLGFDFELLLLRTLDLRILPLVPEEGSPLLVEEEGEGEGEEGEEEGEEEREERVPVARRVCGRPMTTILQFENLWVVWEELY